jgi:hypothetical protein
MKTSVSLVLCLFLLSVPVFALESEPSETVGYVRYECQTTASSTNLNIIALPMDSDITNVTELADEIGVADQIAVWDQSNQAWDASAYIFGSWQPNTTLFPGDVILVSVTSEVDFYSAGALPDPAQYNLVTVPGNTNLNTIMIPLNRDDIIDVTTLATSVGVADQIAVWDHAVQTWDASAYIFGSWNPNNPLEIAYPVLISVTTDTTWPARGESPSSGAISENETRR